MGLRVSWILIIVTGLAVGQVGWWAYMLIHQQTQLAEILASGSASERGGDALSRFQVMIISEGLFFCCALTLGHYWAYRAYRQRVALEKSQADFLGSVTHDLKTPIANIRLALDSLERGLSGINHTGAKYLDRAQRACDLLLSRVEWVLAYTASGVRPRNFEDVEIQTLIDEVRTNFLGDQARVIWPEKCNGHVRIHREEARLILGVLLDNALKYSSKVVRVRVEAADALVGVFVIDEGLGLTKEDLHHVFDPTWRSSRPAVSSIRGAGMGLALARRMADLMDARIELKSQGIDRGCEATLWIGTTANGRQDIID